jgi:hypothetical protein
MIPTQDVKEAAAIIDLAADMLLATSNDQPQGRAGSDLRRACGDIKAYAETYIVENVIAAKLATCFAQATTTGATMDEFNRIREAILAVPECDVVWANNTVYVPGRRVKDAASGAVYKCLIEHTSATTGAFSDDRAAHPNNWGDALSVLAVLIKHGCVCFCLQQMSSVLAATTFSSRNDVDYVRGEIDIAFRQAEEVAADEMAQEVYRALVTLHAAVMFHLYETARPLAQMLAFEFAAIRPTLIQSYRLYSDASRADELRKENKVIHPAFAPRAGRALSF